MDSKEAISNAEARSTLFSFIAAMLSSPRTGKFAALQNDSLQRRIQRTCAKFHLDPKPVLLDVTRIELIRTERKKFTRSAALPRLCSCVDPKLEKDPHSLAIQSVLNETYARFGLLLQNNHRADHISIQAEFLSYLALKERIAIQAGYLSEAENLHAVFYEFFLKWFERSTFELAGTIIAEPQADFYRKVAQFLLELLGKSPEFILATLQLQAVSLISPDGELNRPDMLFSQKSTTPRPKGPVS